MVRPARFGWFASTILLGTTLLAVTAHGGAAASGHGPALATDLAPQGPASPTHAAGAQAGYGVLDPLVRFFQGLRSSPSAPDASSSRAPGPDPLPGGPRAAERESGVSRILRDVLRALWRILSAGGLASIALWHRIAPSASLRHASRQAVMETVCAEPGLHVNALARRTGLNRKTLAYHLAHLQRSRLVSTARDGKFTRVFPNPRPLATAPDTSPMRTRILAFIEQQGGASRRGLARQFRVTPQAVGYHLQALVGERRVLVASEGRERRYLPVR